MTKTFTLLSENYILAPEKVLSVISKPKELEPSDSVVSRILNFSKNLEVKPSGLIKNISYLKS